VAALVREREAARRAAAARLAAAEAAEAPFTPRLSDTSRRLAALRPAPPLLQRLSPARDAAGPAGAGASHRRLAWERAAAEEAREARLRFEGAAFAPPPLGAASARLVAAMDDLGRPTEFLARQAAHAAAAAAAAAAAPPPPELSFSPGVAPRARAHLALASEASAALLSESAAERDARLALREPAERAARARALRARAAAEETPFAPRLSAGTRRLLAARAWARAGEEGGLEGLVSDGRRAEARAAAAAEAERRHAQLCPFRPDTRLSSLAREEGGSGRSRRALPPPLRFILDPDGAEAARRAVAAAREEAAAAAAAAREAGELAECTFAPRRARAPPPPAEAPPIRGLAAFVRQREAAQRLRAEAAARERRAFVTDAAARPARRGATVPQPFELAFERRAAGREAARAALAAEVAAERAAEYTFQPRTNEGTALRRMLACDLPSSGRLALTA